MNIRSPLFLRALWGMVALLLTAFAATSALADIAVREIKIPMTVKGMLSDSHIQLSATEYKPEGDGPFPLLLINHGTPRSQADFAAMKNNYAWQAQLFARRGFVVIHTLRRGYGGSDGPWAENYFNCANPDYIGAGLESAKDIDAALEYGRAQPYVDAKHVVLLGKSAGGFGVLALSSQNPAGVVGTINFAGGRGSRGPDNVCNEGKLVDAFSHYARTTHIPMLWFYSENDHFFGPALAKRLGESYQAKGVDMDLKMVPAYGSDGHSFFEGRPNASVWVPTVDAFFKKIGLQGLQQPS
ncbi:dienelactone hydrolase [Rhodoferax ferrireducens]|uniref:Dienelactone hydrolase n=1 Tax=Rhodoferax ferrireducens TaxID=192843 RepID=A0ABU2C543_9BURK|nr:prolyl oligopeptidase family serine peptidase [Rhodoferax ferrireducens]MDR7376426.1 dienelactone hydrolase [Rhodoferax ferrireducens]